MTTSPPAPIGPDKRPLATWKWNEDRAAYAGRLVDELLRHHPSFVVETAVLVYDLRHPLHRDRHIHHHKARARLWIGTRCFEAIATGPNPFEAKANAELFALRSAALGRDDVPVLGRLFTDGRITVDLEVRGGRYAVVLGNDLRDLPWLPPLKLPRAEYVMWAYLMPPDPDRGTRYMRIIGPLDPDVEALVKPYMKVPDRPLLHRLVLGLARQPISNIQKWHKSRLALGLTGFKGKLLEVHHIDGEGLDNRHENLRPLERYVHHAIHDADAKADFDAALVGGAVKEGLPSIWLPAPTLVSPYGRLGQLGHDRLWGHVDGVAGVAGPPPRRAAGHALGPAAIARIAASPAHLRTLRQALAAIVEAGGQGILRNLKSTPGESTMKRNTLRDALTFLAKHGVVEVTPLGMVPATTRPMPGTKMHFRLLLPLTKGFFGKGQLVVRKPCARP